MLPHFFATNARMNTIRSTILLVLISEIGGNLCDCIATNGRINTIRFAILFVLISEIRGNLSHYGNHSECHLG